jgi:type I restriction enzyme S subunit
MDNEISEIEEKLSKYRNIKIGMMQTLLTGQIRLYNQDTI